MKQILILLAVALTFGLYSGIPAFCQDAVPTESAQSSDWDALFEDEDMDRGRHRGRDRDGDRGFGRGGGRGRGGGGEFGGPGGRSGRGGPGGPGGRDGRGGRSRGPQVDPQALMDFLHQYEPELAQRLETLREEDQRKARRQVRRLSRLYAPVMRQMQQDPEMGQLSLDRIRTQLKIKNQIRQSKEDGAAPLDTAQLKTHVEALFDVIIKQEELRNQKMASHVERWGEMDRPEDQGRGKGRRGPRDPQARLAENKASIEAWKSSKAQIVDQQVQRLISNTRPFPWGRM